MLSLLRKKCTVMNTNRRVFLPSHTPVKEEANLESKNQTWLSVWRVTEKNSMIGRVKKGHQLTREEMKKWPLTLHKATL